MSPRHDGGFLYKFNLCDIFHTLLSGGDMSKRGKTPAAPLRAQLEDAKRSVEFFRNTTEELRNKLQQQARDLEIAQNSRERQARDVTRLRITLEFLMAPIALERTPIQFWEFIRDAEILQRVTSPDREFIEDEIAHALRNATPHLPELARAIVAKREPETEEIEP